MPVIEIPIHSGPYRNTDGIAQKSIEQMINCYIDESGAINKMWGLKLFRDFGLELDGNASLYWWQNKKWLIVVLPDGHIYKVTDAGGNYTDITGSGGADLRNTGNCSFDTDGTYLVVANGGRPVYTDGTTAPSYEKLLLQFSISQYGLMRMCRLMSQALSILTVTGL